MTEFYLYKNYPEGMKDKEIIEHVREYTDVIIKSGAQVNTVWQVTPLIQLGQYELEKRQTKRITWLTTGISIISMFVAGTALWIAIDNSRASARWEEAQLKILSTIQTEVLNKINTKKDSSPQSDKQKSKPVDKPANKAPQPTPKSGAAQL